MIRTGLPGSGKSWSLVKYIVEEWIPNHTGIIYTNVPVNVEALADHFAGLAPSDRRNVVREKIASRVVRIPDHLEQEWVDGLSTPEDYFDGLWRLLCDEAGIEQLPASASQAERERFVSECADAGL